MEFFCIDGKLKDPDAEFFVRQKYHSTADDIHLSTLSPHDISSETPCPCRVRQLPTFTVGDFVLVREKYRLQPYRFEGYEQNSAWVRKLHRRAEMTSAISDTSEPTRVNELLWTEEIIDVPVLRVVRKCLVLAIQDGQGIPPTLEWGKGSSDVYFYRTGSKVPVSIKQNETKGVEMKDAPQALLSDEQKKSSSEAPAALNRSASDADSRPNLLYDVPAEKRLRSLDLFCGGGNFGRGVGDGGAVQHKWYLFH